MTRLRPWKRPAARCPACGYTVAMTFGTCDVCGSDRQPPDPPDTRPARSWGGGGAEDLWLWVGLGGFGCLGALLLLMAASEIFMVIVILAVLLWIAGWYIREH